MKNAILVVDDEAPIRKILFDILSKKNFNVILANNGLDALQKVNQKLPDLIILDWNMPVMNGLETLQQLNQSQRTKDIPVIMLTGVMIDSEDLQLAFDSGAYDFIKKNFDKTELLSRIRAALKFVKYYKETIELKNKELTESALHIINFNNTDEILLKKLKDIDEKISDENHPAKILINELVKELKTKQKKIGWEYFNEHFKTINPTFYQNLLKAHPELSPAELKICALLKLNFNSKEIATITNQATDSIKTTRSRIRKKLNLEIDYNLSIYLMRF